MAQGNRSSNFKVEFGDEQVKQVKEVEQIEQEHRESKVIKILYYLFSLRKNLLVEWCRPEIVARKTFYPKSAIIFDCQPCGNFCPPLPLFQPKPVTLTITWSSTSIHCQCANVLSRGTCCLLHLQNFLNLALQKVLLRRADPAAINRFAENVSCF